MTQIQAQAWQASYALSPHYAQAYMQYNAASLPGGGSPWPMTTSEGYTYSSTFVPGQQSQPFPSTSFSNGGLGTGSSGFPFQTTPAPPSQSWYSPGNARCKQAGCRFSGSAKAVELHMMDRHLVYPPGWDKRKKRPDWDADPSLKGCVVRYTSTLVKLKHCHLIGEIGNPSRLWVQTSNSTHPKRFKHGLQSGRRDSPLLLKYRRSNKKWTRRLLVDSYRLMMIRDSLIESDGNLNKVATTATMLHEVLGCNRVHSGEGVVVGVGVEEGVQEEIGDVGE